MLLVIHFKTTKLIEYGENGYEERCRPNFCRHFNGRSFFFSELKALLPKLNVFKLRDL